MHCSNVILEIAKHSGFQFLKIRESKYIVIFVRKNPITAKKCRTKLPCIYGPGSHIGFQILFLIFELI